jgi:hypothetical protein
MQNTRLKAAIALLSTLLICIGYYAMRNGNQLTTLEVNPLYISGKNKLYFSLNYNQLYNHFKIKTHRRNLLKQKTK